MLYVVKFHSLVGEKPVYFSGVQNEKKNIYETYFVKTEKEFQPEKKITPWLQVI